MATSSPTTKVIPSFDPFSVKEQLVELAEDYFNLNNIDLYESGFMGYLIQALTTVTSDVLYQNAFAYNEAFLGRALLKSSVSNIANQLDYDILSATPASGSLTLVVPVTIGSSTFIKIPSGSAVTAGSIPYKVYNTYYIKQDTAGLHVTSYNTDTGLIEEIPYSIELHDGETAVVFDVEIWQVNIYYYEFTVSNPTLYQFYTESISGYEGEVYKTIVNVGSELYTKVDSLYGCDSDERSYEIKYVNGSDSDDSKMEVKFGNGVYGYQPTSGTSGIITVYTTLGKDGNIVANAASLAVELTNTLDTESGSIDGVESNNNLAINNGENAETLEEIRQHTKENVSAAKRLVTEKDYKGYAGVTGLTNIVAYPILDRRNMNGNEITVFNALYDGDNSLIPTATIPVRMDAVDNIIEKGQEIDYDGVTYVSPFEVQYDDTYDIPYCKYIYELSTTSIAPSLFLDNTPDDVEMGLVTMQSKFYKNKGQVVHIAKVSKLDDMNGTISGILYIGDLDGIALTETSTYSSETTVELSSKYIDYSDYPIGETDWKLELYYTYPDTTEPVFYNTYYGEVELMESGVLVDTEIDFDVEAEYLEDYFTVSQATYYMDSEDATKAVFKLPLAVTRSTDINGDDISHTKISGTCTFNGNEYPMRIYTINSDNTLYTFATSKFEINGIDIGEYDVKFDIAYTSDGSELYSNTYDGKVTIYEEGKSVVGEAITDTPESSDEPKIELVHLSVSSIDVAVTKTDNGNYYTFTVDVNKLHSMPSSDIDVLLTISSDTYTLNQGDPYYLEYGGDMTIAETDDEVANATTVIFTSTEIASEDLSTGEVTFKIELRYQGETVVIYKQSATFRQDISRIIKSDIHKFSDGNTYACGVPVIKKEYYDANLSYLDSNIFSKFLSLNDTFNNYGMLTDRFNMKFVRTCGRSTNMTLNNEMTATAKTYSDDFYVELPIPITAKIYIDSDTSSDTSTIATEAKNIIYTFLTLKSGFHSNVYRSEIARYLHDALDDILFCEITEPTDEIIYDFDISKLPNSSYEKFYKYCPEYVWFDSDSITVEVVLMDV